MSVDIPPAQSLEDFEFAAKISKAEAEAADAILRLEERKATLVENREYLLDRNLDFASVKALIDQIDKWVFVDSKRPIRIIVNCSSGIIQALAVYDYLNWVRAKGVRIIMQVSGICEGQAPIILGAADDVYITEHSHIAISPVGAELRGNTHEAEDYLDWLKRLRQQQHLLLERPNLNKMTLRSKTEFTTWLIDAEEAVRCGLARPVSSLLPRLVTPVSSDLPMLPEAATSAERKLRAECQTTMAQARLAEIDLRNTQADAARQGIVRYVGSVNAENTTAAKRDLIRALRLCPGEINMLIDSPGGVIVNGLGFIDLCQQVQRSGRVINTEVVGYAASMGGALLQLGATRTMGRNAWLLIHRASSWWGSNVNEFEHRLAGTTRLQRQVFELLASRSVFSADEILERCMANDWWIPAWLALEYGFIDQVR